MFIAQLRKELEETEKEREALRAKKEELENAEAKQTETEAKSEKQEKQLDPGEISATDESIKELKAEIKLAAKS